jgi:hypothetical protein
MKSRNIKIIAIFLILLVGATVSASNIDTLDLFKKDLNEVGLEIRNIKDDETNKKTVMEVGDTKISLQNFKTVGAMLKTDDENKINDYIVERVLIRKIAKERGITTTDKEIKKYIQELREFINSNEEARKKFNVYLSNLGYSEEEFWSSESTFEQYKNMLIEGKYRGLLREKYMSKYNDKAVNEIEKLVTEEVKKSIEVEKGKVQIRKHSNK